MHVFAVQWERTDPSCVWERRQPRLRLLSSFILTIIILCVRAHPHPPSLPRTPRPPLPRRAALSPSFSLRRSRRCTVTARGAVSRVLIKRQKKGREKKLEVLGGGRDEGEELLINSQQSAALMIMTVSFKKTAPAKG